MITDSAAAAAGAFDKATPHPTLHTLHKPGGLTGTWKSIEMVHNDLRLNIRCLYVLSPDYIVNILARCNWAIIIINTRPR